MQEATTVPSRDQAIPRPKTVWAPTPATCLTLANSDWFGMCFKKGQTYTAFMLTSHPLAQTKWCCGSEVTASPNSSHE